MSKISVPVDERLRGHEDRLYKKIVNRFVMGGVKDKSITDYGALIEFGWFESLKKDSPFLVADRVLYSLEESDSGLCLVFHRQAKRAILI